MADKFWMVKGRGPATAKHLSEQIAVQEAQRLARMNPGETFVVVEATRAFVKADVVEVGIQPRRSEETPF